MKSIKSFILLILSCIVLASCSSANQSSKEFSIDAVNITCSSPGIEAPSCEHFSVVPGTYKVEWRESSAGYHQYAIGITLKLKLEKPIKDINMGVQEEYSDSYVQMIPYVNNYREYVNMTLINNYWIHLLDASGNEIQGGIPGVGLSLTTDYAKWLDGAVDQSAAEKFREFLASEPGTEAEFTFGHACWATDLAQAERCLQVNGISITSAMPNLFVDFPTIQQ